VTLSNSLIEGKCTVVCVPNLRAPLKIHFGGQANLFDSGLRQEKTALVSTKADFPSLPEYKNLLLSAQKQLLELPLNRKQLKR
jgi:hypothetical protein